MKIRAVVTSGRGWATKDRIDDIAAISAIDGKTFVNGSLNLIATRPVWLEAGSAIYRKNSQIFWHASLEGMPVVLGRWLSGCPAHVFEIFAPVRLRDALHLQDGDSVDLEISDEIISRSAATCRDLLVWNVFWKYRERLVYRDGLYMSLFRSRAIRWYASRSMQSTGCSCASRRARNGDC